MSWFLKKRTEMGTSTTTAQARDYKTVTGYAAKLEEVEAGYPAATLDPYEEGILSDDDPYDQEGRLSDVDVKRRRPDITIVVAVMVLCTMLLARRCLVELNQVPEFRVDSATVSPLNLTRSSELTATWELKFLATSRNPKTPIFYVDDLLASLFYGNGTSLATTSLAPFVLNNQTGVGLKFETVRKHVGDDVAKEISDGKGRGSVSFGVVVHAWGRFDMLQKEVNHSMRIFCKRVEFGFSPNNGTGTLMGQSREGQCDVMVM